MKRREPRRNWTRLGKDRSAALCETALATCEASGSGCVLVGTVRPIGSIAGEKRPAHRAAIRRRHSISHSQPVPPGNPPTRGRRGLAQSDSWLAGRSINPSLSSSCTSFDNQRVGVLQGTSFALGELPGGRNRWRLVCWRRSRWRSNLSVGRAPVGVTNSECHQGHTGAVWGVALSGDGQRADALAGHATVCRRLGHGPVSVALSGRYP
jgi:hypothetical protein